MKKLLLLASCALLGAAPPPVPQAPPSLRDQEVALLAAVAHDGLRDRSDARLALAHFYATRGRAVEAAAVLDVVLADRPALGEDPHFLALRGRVRVQTGDYRGAVTDLDAPVLLMQPESCLWKGFALERVGDAKAALSAYACGMPALTGRRADSRAVFLLSGVRAALAVPGQLDRANRLLMLAKPEDAVLRGERAYWMAVVNQRMGRTNSARAWFRKAARDGNPAAALHARIALFEQEARDPQAMMAQLDRLRFSWRGGESERRLLDAKARMAMAQNDPLRALRALDMVARYLPPDKQSATRSATIAQLFDQLMNDGGTRQGTIRALAAYWEFRHLAPRGPVGDAMALALVERLEALDLPGQAAGLLAWQVEQRMAAGPERAAAAMRLARLYRDAAMADHALAALRLARIDASSHAPDVALARQEAAILVDLGRADEAAALLEGDKAPEAVAILSEIAWRRNDWAGVLRTLDGRLPAAGLLEQDHAALALALRYVVAATMLGDETRLAQARAQYRPYLQAPDLANLFDVLTGDPHAVPPDRLTAAINAAARRAARG